MKKYSEEKVLYFASKSNGFNVDLHEPAHTDITRIVTECLRKNYLVEAASDDSDIYYITTPAGKKRLEQYQAEYQLNKLSRG
ncbi:hypothetical protein [Serratia phage SP1]|nr:hypothetical protein [Serratia phage SP1]